MKVRIKKAILIMLVDLAVLLALTTALGAKYAVNSLLESQIEKDLTATAYVMMQIYGAHEGTYRLDASGKAYKGDFCISDHTEIVDDIYSKSGNVATFFYGDTRKVTSIKDAGGKRITDTKTSDPAVLENVLKKGQTYFNKKLDIQGKNYYVLYYPVCQEGGKDVIGMTFVGIERSPITSSILKAIGKIMMYFGVIAGVTFIVTIKLLNSIIAAVYITEAAAKTMAEGNLAFEVSEKTCKRIDEMGDVYRSLLNLRESMTKLFGDVKQQSDDLMNTSDSLDKMAEETARSIESVESAVDGIAKGATSQAQDTTKAQSDIVQMGSLIEQTVGEVADLRKVSNQMTESGETAFGILNELIKVNEDAVKAIDLIAKQTDETNEAALKIREATDLITAIAEETNLLSLNASIEAARAGEAGRGFAVVADQISKLAEQSNQSGQEIEEITKALISESEKAVATMKEVREIMADQAEKMTTTSEAFSVVKDGIGVSRNNVENINTMTDKLDQARKDIIAIIQNLTAVAEENAASTEETSASATEVAAGIQSVATAADSLKKVTEQLEVSVSKFKF